MRIKIKRSERIIAVVLAVLLLISCIPTGLWSDDMSSLRADAAYDIDGADYPLKEIINNKIQDTIDSIALQEEKKGRIRLEGDYSENITVPDECEILLDLNGHTLSPVYGSSDPGAIVVYGTIKLVDTAGGGHLVSNGTANIRGVDIVSGGKFIFAGGALEGFHSDSNGAGILVEENGYLNLSGGKIKNCSSSLQGGGIFVFNTKDVDLTGGEISSCTAENGGGIYFYRSQSTKTGAPLEISAVDISRNTVTGNGGGIYAENEIYIILNGSTLDENEGVNGGGAYFNRTVGLTINGQNSISDNEANMGGGIYFNVLTTDAASSFTMNSGRINRNTAVKHGGGIYFHNVIPLAPTYSEITINGGEINENVSGESGGGICTFRKSKVTMTGGSIDGNTSRVHGAGIFVDSSNSVANLSEIRISGGSISDNISNRSYIESSGTGLFSGNYNKVWISGGEISRNDGARYGAGMYIGAYCSLELSGTVSICDNVAYHPNASVYGAGVYMGGYSTSINGSFIMTGGTISGNNANNSRGGNGGGLYIGTPAFITGGVISDNAARGSGGGMVLNAKSVIDGNTLIKGNSAIGGYGAGVYGGNVLDIGGNVIIEDNTCTSLGGGVYVNSDQVDEDGVTFELRDDVIIRNNSASSGGGVYAGIHYDPNTRSPFVMKMTGGTITGNSSTSHGGGLFIRANNLNYLLGGEITNNTSGGCGGGVYLHRRLVRSNKVNCDPPTLRLAENLTISGNTAADAGGGVYVVNYARLELKQGAKVVNNNAKNGGGIYVHCNSGRDFLNNETEALEITGGELHSNSVSEIGHDIYINEGNPSKYGDAPYYDPYISVVKASDMSGASAGDYWLEETSHARVTTALDNRDKVDAAQTPRYSVYTFRSTQGDVAAIEGHKYPSIQDAVDDIAAGTAVGTNIELLKSTWENVVIPSGLTVSLDLAGHNIISENGPVFEVTDGAVFNITDSVGGSVLSEGSGKILEGGTYINQTGGGAFFVRGAQLSASNITMSYAHVKNGQAVYADNNSIVSLEDCIIENNRYSNPVSMVLIIDSELNAEGCVFRNNYSRAFDFNGSSSGHISNCEIYQQSGIPVYIVGSSVVEVDHCNLHDNSIGTNSNNGAVTIGSGATAYVRNTEIRGNTSGNGTGIWNNGTLYLEDSVITDNNATGYSGGVFNYSSGARLYIKNSKIYGNRNSSNNVPGKDLYLAKDSYFFNSSDTGDHRYVEQWGTSEADCWYDELEGNYIREDKSLYSGSNVTVNDFSDLLNADNRAVRVMGLSADLFPDVQDSVAELVNTGEIFCSLSKAVRAAIALEEDAEIRLLKDTSDKVKIINHPYCITLDLNGHKLTALPDENAVVLLNKTELKLKDSEGGGKINPPDKDQYNISKIQAVKMDSAVLTIESGEISGFEFNGSGAAINVNTIDANNPSKLFIRGGVIADNKATAGYGGALYFYCVGNGQSVFEMSGGVFRNNSCSGSGGAIFYDVNTSTVYQKFMISGGSFEGNSASSSAGAVYINGRGVDRRADVKVYGAEFTGNHASASGGAIYFDGVGSRYYKSYLGDPSVPTVFSNNSANDYGALVMSYYNANCLGYEVTNCEFDSNTAVNSGSHATFSTSDLTITDCSFHGGNCLNYSGVNIAGANLYAENLEVYDNYANANVSGLYVSGNENGTRLVKNCSVHDNSCNNSSSGLADDVRYEITYENCKFYNNSSSGAKIGGYAAGKRVNFIGCEIYDNIRGVSAENSNGLTLYFKDTYIHNNVGDQPGAAIYFYANNSVLTSHSEIIIDEGTVISDNRTTNQGGAIYVMRNCHFTMLDGEIKDNYSGSSGGAIYYSQSEHARFEITGGKITGNTAVVYGGGILFAGFPQDDYAASITNVEISDNKAIGSAANYGYGGGLFLTYNATSDTKQIRTDINNARITGNYAKYGGGVFLGDFSEYVGVRGSSVIKGNYAESSGGGVYISSRRTRFYLSSKQLYGNSSMLGNDVYIAYYTSYRTSSMYLMKPSLMFGGSDEYRAVAWLEELSNAKYTDAVQLRPLGRSYAYTLSYRNATDKIVAVYGGVEYTSLQSAIDALKASAQPSTEIILVDDVFESVSVPAGCSITLNLNGRSIKGVGSSAITSRGDLTIVDNKREVTAGGNTYAQVDSEGTITGTAAKAGGGIYVISGVVTMKQGTICDCFAGGGFDNNTSGGAAVAVASGEFVLDGGTIRDNTAKRGAGVLVMSVASKFTMKSGSIINNQSSKSTDPNSVGSGAAVFNNGGRVSITGGTISGNAAFQGGAIYHDNGTTSITGTDPANKPLLTNNTAGYSGGAIFVRTGSFIIENTEITNNRTTYPAHSTVTNSYLTQSAGGAIFVGSGNLFIGDRTLINNNRAVRGGAIYQQNGTVQITGEHTLITQNRANFGGGCAQYPLPGNATTSMSLSDGAAVYENISMITSAGNDFYSAWEGTNTYREALGSNTNNTPRLSLIPASSMNTSGRYNVWKNDAFDSTGRTGTSYVSGQYITAEVLMCNNVQLTAAYFSVPTETSIESRFKVTGFEFSSVSDGTSYFDDGSKVGSQYFDNASEKEIFASTDLSGAVELPETYVYNNTTYHYIEYNGKKYEQGQAIEWWPGDDSGAENFIVRSFDSVLFKMAVSYTSVVPQEDLPDISDCHLRFRAVLPCSSEDATFSMPTDFGLMNATISPSTDRNGNPIQVLTGYWELKIASDNFSGQFSRNISIYVNGMKNGSLIKPEFECWFEGNDNDPHGECISKTITVSAAPKYNITLLNNEQLTYTSYFDIESGTEVSEEHANDPNVVFGTMLGFGVTAELYNDPVQKRLKGIEIPKSGMNFDISFKGSLYNEYGTEIPNMFSAPIIWAYKENENNDLGRKIGDSANIINMDWADDDSISKNTHYAYYSAPYNTGNNASSCYSGGSWNLSNVTQSGEQTTVHAELNGYAFDNSYNPIRNSPQNSPNSSILQNDAVKAFTAGYVQVILPFSSEPPADLSSGFYKIGMDAVASGMHAESVTGQLPDNVQSNSSLYTEEMVREDLNYMNEYYHFPDEQDLKTNSLAVGERRYADNFIRVLRTLRLSFGQNGNSDEISKRNIFYDEQLNALNDGLVQYGDTGKGDTAINSTVYMEGFSSFYSGAYDTSDPDNPQYYMLNDPLYDTEIWNMIEYDYLTAYNILQKFDADAYTPVGAEPIVRVPNDQISRKVGDSFKIGTSESEASWSKDATRSYDLTILYAAKKDGSNWSKIESVDTLVTPNITYDDGGVADMDAHCEENLLYFTSLDDLHRYLGEDAKCVAILYQFRNCCIRTDRSIATKALMNVTGDFEKVGSTYCTTNDVRAWTTYRPHYKVYYGSGKQAEHIYQFNWTDMVYSEDVDSTGAAAAGLKVYGAGLDTGHTYAELPEYTQNGAYDDFLENYQGGYSKTRYRNGVQVAGSHNGCERGNTLLLYSLDTSVAINIETKIKDSNTTKTSYKINEGERDVTYSVSPDIKISSSAKKTELIQNGTLETELTITLSLPEHLNYQKGSIRLDYSDPECGYEDGGLEWEEHYDEANSKVYLTTKVSDIDRKLPLILFDCKIGDENDPDNDIKENGLSLPIIAEIQAKYTERNIFAAEAHSSTVSIEVTLTEQEGISKSVKEKQLELGEDIVYDLTYGNSVKIMSTNIQTYDVLPHNNDGRGTEFNGGYRVKAVRLLFSSETDYDNYVSSGGELWFNSENKHWSAEIANDPEQMKQLIASLDSATAVSTGYSGNQAEKTITYDFSGLGVGTTKFKPDQTLNDTAPVMYVFIPTIQGENRITIRVVLTPMNDSGNELIVSTGNEGFDRQAGGDEYDNCFFYRKITGTDTYSTPLLSNITAATVVKRIVKGTVWMDQDQDGFYNTPSSVEYDNTEAGEIVKVQEYPIANVLATLYYADSTGHPDTTRIVTDILGNTVEPVLTDSNGNYMFENLRKGDYVVVFTENSGTPYKYMKPQEDEAPGTDPAGIHPIDFSRLSVTTSEHSLTVRGNKCYEAYDPLDYTKLVSGTINRKITLPEKDKIPGAVYTSPNWNLGLYFVDLEIEKHWDNMRDLDSIVPVADGTKVVFDVYGRQDITDELLFQTELVLTKTSTGVTAQLGGIQITEIPDGDSFIWKFTRDSGIFLQAKNERGRIVYSYRERGVTLNSTDISQYYNEGAEEKVDDVTKDVTLDAANGRIRGSVTIGKVTGGGDPLVNAEFSIYQVSNKRDPADTSFYSANASVGTAPLDNAYSVQTSQLSYKVLIGGDMQLTALKDDGKYNETEKLVNVSGNAYKVHQELYQGSVRYYYFISTNTPLDYIYIIGGVDDRARLVADGIINSNGMMTFGTGKYAVRSRTNEAGDPEYYISVRLTPSDFEREAVVEFKNLPLFDNEGRPIYYTVRETRVPQDYYSLGDFNQLTGMDLYNGAADQVHDLTFTVVNNRRMELPLTGTSTSRKYAVVGTVMIVIGGAYLMMVIRKKRKIRGDRTA